MAAVPNEVTIVIKSKDQSDFAPANAKVDKLAAKVRALPDGEITVDVDAGKAEADLHGVKAELGRVDGKTAHANVDVDVGSALAKIGLVMAALAAASAAAAGIGAAVGLGAIAAGGIGAAVAGLSGIGDATKALGEQTKGAGAAASQAASNQLTLAGAMDRVRSAQQSLANTRANAADSARRSAEQQADAQRDLISAEQDLKAAQQDLNRARADAARQIEDLKRQEEDLALTQRGAALDVEEAQQRLNDVMADRRASGMEKARAQLAFDEAVHRAEELARQAEDLAAKKADADRRGVAGSDQVTAAQKRVAEQAAKVAEAHRRVTDAAKDAATQQRQAAFQVQQAQQSVVDAQRAVQAASIAAGSAGAAGIDKLHDAMANLSPTGQAFARFLRGFIDGPIRDLRFATQEGLLPGLQKGLASLGPVIQANLPAIKQFSTVLGQALGGLIEIAGKLTAPFLKLATVGLQALAPLKGVLDQFADAFGKMVDQVTANGSLQAAMDGLVKLFGALLLAVPKVLPSLIELAVKILPSLVELVEVLVPIMADLAEVFGDVLVDALRVITPMLEWFGGFVHDHQELVADLAEALIAVSLAVTLIGAVMAVVAAGPVVLIAAGIAAITAAFIIALNHIKGFGIFAVRAFDAVNHAAGNVGHALGNLVRVAQGAARGVRTAWDAVVGFFRGLPGRFASAGAHMWDWIKQSFRAAVNGLIDIWNNIHFPRMEITFPKVHIPGTNVDIGGGSFGFGPYYVPQINHLASGGIGSGLAMVGEHGRELVRLPQGSTVIPNGATENMLAGGQQAPVVLEIRSGGSRMDDLIVELIRNSVRVRGGNVQVVLGSA